MRKQILEKIPGFIVAIKMGFGFIYSSHISLIWVAYFGSTYNPNDDEIEEIEKQLSNDDLLRYIIKPIKSTTK